MHSIHEALEDLKSGKPVIVVDDDDRENEGDFVCLAEKVTPDLINFMITHGRGLVCMPMTEERAEELNLPMMVRENTDRHETAFTVSVDAKETETGISAFERAKTIQSLIKPSMDAKDFRRPGHVFPLVAKSGGVLRRAGHTEASVDLARLCGSYPAGVICEILREDGTMARLPDLMLLSQKFDIKIVMIQDLIHYRRKKETLVESVVSVNIPTEYGLFKLVGYQDLLEGKEHLAFVKGEISSKDPVLVRVHSECLTGDVFGSHRCDCGPQLQSSLEKISEEGAGVLLYMRQEGRGIGLFNKLKAYKLQDEGFDTVEANIRLGFRDDLREYGIGAQILKDIGISRMRLLTNNPRKITGLKGYGLEVVEVIPMELPPNQNNRKYMETKKMKLGHLLNL